MSIVEQTRFLKSILPFDRLSLPFIQQAASSLDIVYFPLDSIVPLDRRDHAYIYIVLKGRISESSHDDRLSQSALYGENAQFGANIILNQQTSNLTYQAIEESILYRLPAQVFHQLLKGDTEFESFYFNDITQKLSHFHRQLQTDASSEAMMDAVKIAPLHALVEIDMQTSIKQCVELMESYKTDACLVKQAHEYGVVTASDLLRGLAIQGFDLTGPVANLVSFPAISIQKQDYLFNALLKMTRYGVDRLMVKDGDTYIGVLHQKELMSLFANQSSLVMLTLERATSFEDLKKVTTQIDALIAGLSNKGVKTHYIAKLVNELHRKLQAKLWQILDYEHRFAEVTFIVMGSEGRSEQVIRTDQDNAVIYDDKIDADALGAFCEDFSHHLIQLGFPPCDGNIMVSNPAWRMTLSGYKKLINTWFDHPTMTGFMNLSILCDAQSVIGDPLRLATIKQSIGKQIENNSMFLPHFARAVIQFDTPIGLFGRWITQKDAGHSIDLKKGGIFPIVHGIRCLALERGIEKTNTHWRIRELINHHVFNEAFGIELGETLNYLNTLRLESMLVKQARGQLVDNLIEIDQLNHYQQDLLKDSFNVVNQFKKIIEHHFKLDRI
jgi:CBS domain-containing protein